MSFKKNTAVTGFPFALISATDGSAITSGTPVLYYTLDGGAQATVAGSATHEGNGQWSVNLTAGEMNGDVVGLLCTITGGIPVHYTIKTDTKIVSELADVTTAQVNAEVDSALADYDAPTKAELDSGLAALNNVSTADVNAQVVDVLSTDTWSLPGQAAPPGTPTFVEMVSWLYKVLRNKKTATEDTIEIYNDAGTVVDSKRTIGDDGTTYTEDEIVSGP